MHPLFRACALALVIIPLAACASVSGSIPALTDNETFRRVCAERANAYALFLAYDAAQPVSSTVRKSVRITNNQIANVCANPPADLADATAIVSRAVSRIRAAIGKA